MSFRYAQAIAITKHTKNTKLRGRGVRPGAPSPKVVGPALDAGPLASARTLEGLTAVIVNINRRYRAHAGIRVTGVDT